MKLVAFFVLLAGTAFLGWRLVTKGAPLRAAGTKRAIVDLQLAWTKPRAEAVVEKWRKANVVDVARDNIREDFAFIVFYASLLALVCFSAASHLTGAWHTAGLAIAWAMLVAGVLDCIENFGCLSMLNGNFTFVTLVSICAALKFALLGIGILFALVAYLVR